MTQRLSTAPQAMDDLDAVDLSNPDIFDDGVPHTLFARMRVEAPIRWNAMPDEPGFWSLTKAADIEAVSRDTETFSSYRGGTMVRDEAVVPLDMMRLMLVNMDPPQHTKYRQIVQRAFTPRRIEDQEHKIRQLTRQLLDDAAEKGKFDLVADVAIPLPIIVIAEMLGVPASDNPTLLDWTNRLAGFDDVRLREDGEDGLTALWEMAAYLHELVAERKREPRDDLVSALIAAEVDGERLMDMEIAAFFGLLVAAGNETTRSTYAGGMHALLEHPDQHQRLLDDPSLIPNAVEEMLRWVSAVMHFRRTATRDIRISDVAISEGDKVVMWYVSANRDEEFIEGPDRFDVGRQAVPHHAFGGGGRHFCLGAGLARLEMRVMLEETLGRLPRLHLAGEPKRMRSTLFNALLELPVAATPPEGQ